jgi:hypothetical protein
LSFSIAAGERPSFRARKSLTDEEFDERTLGNSAFCFGFAH